MHRAQQLFEQLFPDMVFDTTTERLNGEDDADYDLRISRTAAAIWLDDVMDRNMIEPDSDAGRGLIRVTLAQIRRTIQ